MAKATTGKTLTCNVCGKKFSMPAHLGRHQTAIHGARPKTAKKKTKKKAKRIVKKAKNGRRKRAVKRIVVGKRGGRRPGRPPAIATRLGLAKLSIDDLAALIKAARQEADRRLRSFKQMLAK